MPSPAGDRSDVNPTAGGSRGHRRVCGHGMPPELTQRNRKVLTPSPAPAVGPACASRPRRRVSEPWRLLEQRPAAGGPGTLVSSFSASVGRGSMLGKAWMVLSEPPTASATLTESNVKGVHLVPRSRGVPLKGGTNWVNSSSEEPVKVKPRDASAHAPVDSRRRRRLAQVLALGVLLPPHRPGPRPVAGAVPEALALSRAVPVPVLVS